MQCRRLIKNGDKYDIVWFGSYGTIENEWIFLPSFDNFEGSAEFDTITFKLGQNNDTYSYIKFDFDSENVITCGDEVIYTKSAGWSIPERTLTVINGEDDDFIETMKLCATNRTRFYNPENKHDNYSSDTDAVVDSLIARLSLIKGELWYQIDFGLSLLDKHKNKGVLDMEIITIITSHPYVRELLSFNSSLSSGGEYSVSAKIVSVYGENLEITKNF